MDKSWIHLRDRFNAEYILGVKRFLKFAKENLGDVEKIRCPCRYCKNADFRMFDEVENHLYSKGMDSTYNHWIYHGETLGYNLEDNDQVYANEERTFAMEDTIDRRDVHEIIHDIQMGNSMRDEGSFIEQDNASDSFSKILRDAETDLYPGCKSHSLLSVVIKLLHLKSLHHLSNKAFDENVKFIKSILPEKNILPSSFYECKKILRELGLGYDMIHACINDCVLFWKDLEDANECPECKTSRWKVNNNKDAHKKVPQKVLRYFPLKPRLQRLFVSQKTAVDMRWHEEKRVKEGNLMRHPADSETWKEFDRQFPWFAMDPRNVRLGLASDGFNPFGNMNNAYSMWPVIMIPYNLPPWKCMKDPFLLMTLLIPGRRSPGMDIDVFLQPLVNELKELWEQGVQTYDAVSGESFKMHAAVLWTVSDFPAYGDLSGWSTKGYKACPVCKTDALSIPLKDKIGFLGHRCYLPNDHPWRRSRKFNGLRENRSPPKEFSSEEILAQLEPLKNTKFGKSKGRKRKRATSSSNWTKRSILFEIPYWRNLKLRHNLDVMHIEKNVCESIMGTLLDIEGKNKDTIKARMDLEKLGIRKELHLKYVGNQIRKPPACFTLSKKEKKIFYDFLSSIKFPDGYAGNISKCVRTEEGKIIGLKSHDCHVLIQRLLHIGMRGFLNKDVLGAINDLAEFFRELCSRTLKVEILENLQKKIVLTLCKLEMIFPPAFFDVMVHLVVHLPQEAILGGPVQYRWMYPIERFLGKLKRNVRNKAHPEGSIAEAYIVNECTTFCSMYLHGVETQFNRRDRYDDGDDVNLVSLSVFSQNIRLFGHKACRILNWDERQQLHWYVLHNCEEIDSYLSEHEGLLLRESMTNVLKRQKEQFPLWFQQKMRQLHKEGSQRATKELCSLAEVPDIRVNHYHGCVINGVKFLIEDFDKRLVTQNSGVVVEGEHKGNLINFYGILIDILQLRYPNNFQVILFKCKWYELERNKPIYIDKDCTSVNITKTWYEDDPYLLPSQAVQVFYVGDTKLVDNWKIAQRAHQRHLYEPILLDTIDTINNQANFNSIACDAFQQESCNEINNIDDNHEIDSLDRTDIEGDVVNVEVIRNQHINISINDEDDVDCNDENLLYNANEDDTDEETYVDSDYEW